MTKYLNGTPRWDPRSRYRGLFLQTFLLARRIAMQTKKENCLVQTNLTLNEEVEMKDYKLEQLEENY